MITGGLWGVQDRLFRGRSRLCARFVDGGFAGVYRFFMQTLTCFRGVGGWGSAALCRACAAALLAGLLPVGCARDAAPSREVQTTRHEIDGVSFRRIQTEHFTIYSTLRDEFFEGGVASIVEAAYAESCRIVSVSPRDADRFTTFVFGRRSEWEQFAAMRYPARHELYSLIRHGGFTEGSTSVLFFTDRARTLATIAHEVWHQFANERLAGGMPTWLNEGLACRVESWSVAGEVPQPIPSKNTFRIQSLREAVRHGHALPLSVLVDTSPGQMLRDGGVDSGATYYGQVWALTEFLSSESAGRSDAWRRMLADLGAGRLSSRISASALTNHAGERVSEGAALLSAYFDRPLRLDGEFQAFSVGVLTEE